MRRARASSGQRRANRPLFVTLDKSGVRYSADHSLPGLPDLAVLFHWESQNSTSSGSETGRRYIEHGSGESRSSCSSGNGRRTSVDQTAPYVCLGPVRLLQHELERPMRITWALDRPMPAELFQPPRSQRDSLGPVPNVLGLEATKGPTALAPPSGKDWAATLVSRPWKLDEMPAATADVDRVRHDGRAALPAVGRIPNEAAGVRRR